MNDYNGTIVYIGAFELPDKNASAHRVVNNAKIFSELGYKTVFLGITNNSNDLSEKQYPFGTDFPLAYPENVRQWCKRLFCISHYKDIISKTDNVKMVIIYDLQFYPSMELRKYCRKRRIPIVVDKTEWNDYRFSFNPLKLIRFLDTVLTMHFAIKQMDGLIAISKYLSNYYSRYIPTVTIPPLVDIQDEIWSPTVKYDNEIVNFIYAGQPGTTKDNLPMIISALNAVSYSGSFVFHIYGITREQFLNYNKDFESMINTLRDKVIFHGYVSHDESVEALKKCDYSLIIRNKTRKNMAGFPTKFVESTTCGTNIIATNCSNIGDYAHSSHNKIILIDVLSQEVLERTFIEVIKNPNKTSKSSIANVFDYKNYTSDLEKFIGAM